MPLARVAVVAVLALGLLLAPAQAEERQFHLRGHPHGHHQVYGGYGGGRKMLDSGSPSRVIVNGEVVYESSKPPAPPSGFPEDNPTRGGDDSTSPPCPLGTLPSFGSASGMAMFGGGPPPMTGLGSPPPSYGYSTPPPANFDDAPRLGYFFNGKPCTPIPPPPSPPSPSPPAEPDFDGDMSPPALFGSSPPSFDDHGGEESGSGKGKGGGKDD